MTQLTMETTFRTRTAAVCQLRAVAEPKQIVWGCYFNPQSDLSIDRMADERSAYLKQHNAEIIWPE